MTKLNQIVAIEKSVKTTAGTALTNAYHQLQRTAAFAGIVKTYQPKDEEGDQLPGEKQLVQQNVQTILTDLIAPVARMVDIVATKDTANGLAKADIVIDGQVIAADVPVTTLLWLEKQLVDIKTVVSKLPTLDPEVRWAFNDQVGVFESDPVQTVRQKKTTKNVIVVPATEKHPAQWTQQSEDVIEGTWTTVRLSGAITAHHKQELLGRVTVLTEAIKKAREEANSMTVTDVAIGREILEFLFD